jgi:hypothetical protein
LIAATSNSAGDVAIPGLSSGRVVRRLPIRAVYNYDRP